MCDICLHNPHLTGCPNAPEPPTVWKCRYCGESIFAGDDYFEVDGDHYHLDCGTDCSTDILIDKFGATKGIAKLPEREAADD